MSSIPSRNIPDEVVQFIAEFVRQNHHRGRKTDGAYLAAHIRQRGFNLDEMGIRLSEAVAVAEEKGLVVRNRGVAHLEVVPPLESGQPQEDGKQERLPSVRAEIWRALVFVHQRTRLFVNRTNGRLTTESEGATPSIGEQPEWARLEPVSPDTQKKWMHVFVSGNSCLSVENVPTDAEKWWDAFPAWLREQDPQIEFEWRRFRTQKVVEYLREWAKRENVPTGFVFAALPAFRMGTAGPKALADDVEILRKALMAAISEMPLEELERLSIPVRYITRHFKAR